MPRAIYPGTFDPVTLGHLDVLRRSCHLFEQVDVVVSVNPGKHTLFTAAERADLLRECTADLTNLRITHFHGLTVDYLRAQGVRVIIRGLRALSDFEYEYMMAMTNQKLYSECETIYVVPNKNFAYLNSSTVKEIASLGGDVSEFVPVVVREALRAKYAKADVR